MIFGPIRGSLPCITTFRLRAAITPKKGFSDREALFRWCFFWEKESPLTTYHVLCYTSFNNPPGAHGLRARCDSSVFAGKRNMKKDFL